MTFKRNDRVQSNVAGFYMGQLGTVIGISPIRYDADTRYIIELDFGKRIVLPSRQIEKINK